MLILGSLNRGQCINSGLYVNSVCCVSNKHRIIGFSIEFESKFKENLQCMNWKQSQVFIWSRLKLRHAYRLPICSLNLLLILSG